MPTLKKSSQLKSKSSFKKKISLFIYENGDTHWSSNGMIDKKKVIDQIFELYSSFFKGCSYNDAEMLKFMSNDLLLFVKGKSELSQQLYQSILKKTLRKKQADRVKIEKFLEEIPVYYLLSILGLAYHINKSG